MKLDKVGWFRSWNRARRLGTAWTEDRLREFGVRDETKVLSAMLMLVSHGRWAHCSFDRHITATSDLGSGGRLKA
jgi:hypothetical protein